MQNLINSNMERYCIYLRKSRKDIEAESQGAGDTLARHEKIMLDLAKSRNIIIEKIYREIVSGDSISARPVMQELLQDVEDGMWHGVLVVEIERLARGNTMDQGIVSEAFKYSDTLIITPSKTYDPNNEFDEEYFEFGLFMSRREYKTIKRRLHRGILSSVKEGKFVASTPPFGYDKYKLKGKGYSLKPNENAGIVKTIFEMYTSGNNLGEIITALNSLGLKPPQQGKKWYKSTLQTILCNIVYAGKIQYIDKRNLKKRDPNGKIIYVKNPNPDIYIVNGLHDAIVPEEMYNKAQVIYKSHQLADTRTKDQFELKNPLTTIIKCKICGTSLKRFYSEKSLSAIERIGCKNHCVSTSHLADVEQKVFDSLKIILNEYKLDINKSTKNIEINGIINPSNAPKKYFDQTIYKLEQEIKSKKREVQILHGRRGKYQENGETQYYSNSMDWATQNGYSVLVYSLEEIDKAYENFLETKFGIKPDLSDIVSDDVKEPQGGFIFHFNHKRKPNFFSVLVINRENGKVEIGRAHV